MWHSFWVVSGGALRCIRVVLVLGLSPGTSTRAPVVARLEFRFLRGKSAHVETFNLTAALGSNGRMPHSAEERRSSFRQ